MRPRGERVVRLLGAGAGWAGGLVTPSHGLGAGRNASFLAGGFFASLILGFLPVEHGLLVLGRFLRLGSGGSLVFMVTVERPAGASGRRSRTERGESECEASCQQKFLHREDLIWSIFSIWGGERLLYGRTVFRGVNGTRRHGGNGENSRLGQGSISERAARLTRQALLG